MCTKRLRGRYITVGCSLIDFAESLSIIIATHAWQLKSVAFHLTVVISCILAILPIIFVLAYYKTSVQLSEGTFRDRGFWSYPRYEVSFDRFAPGKDVSKTIKVAGLPPCTMLLGMRLVDHDSSEGSSQVQDRIKSNFQLDMIDITARITNSSGIEICSVTRPLSEWSISSSTTETYFWHEYFSFIVNARTEYEISIRLHSRDEKVELPRLEAFIRGGGSELP